MTELYIMFARKSSARCVYRCELTGRNCSICTNRYLTSHGKRYIRSLGIRFHYNLDFVLDTRQLCNDSHLLIYLPTFTGSNASDMPNRYCLDIKSHFLCVLTCLLSRTNRFFGRALYLRLCCLTLRVSGHS